MKRLVKEEGFGNVRMQEVAIPTPEPDQLLVRVKRSLISAGSELFARYVRQEAVSPDIMGYSGAGEVVESGDGIRDLEVGDSVAVSAPHAQYVLGREVGTPHRAFRIHEDIDQELRPFLFLTRSCLMWADTTPVRDGDTVVVLGQGLIGAIYAQVIRARDVARVVAVDGHPLRCEISRRLGADHVIDYTETEPVAEVRRLTEGRGADVVVDCVGGSGGIASFEHAQAMIRDDGAIHLIGKYQGAPLPLHGDQFMNKVLVAGIRVEESVEEYTSRAEKKILGGEVNVRDLITHRLPWQETPAAYRMLYNHPEGALGVILEWD